MLLLNEESISLKDNTGANFLRLRYKAAGCFYQKMLVVNVHRKNALVPSNIILKLISKKRKENDPGSYLLLESICTFFIHILKRSQKVTFVNA